MLLSQRVVNNVQKGKLEILPNLECDVADFETSERVMGTGFWRGPEVLLALKNRTKIIHLDPKVWIEKADVYSYAMTVMKF